MSYDSRLEQALALAELGFEIFPLRPGSKVPYGKESWVELKTSDVEQIQKWFEHRDGMNYGVCPGERGVVIDLDTKKGKDGVAAFQEYQEAYGHIDTLEVTTPSGGKHVYLSSDSSHSNAHMFPDGIDVRGAGGYVVGPGCIAVDDNTGVPGEYEVSVDADVSPAPGWVVERLKIQEEVGETSSLFELDTPANVSRANAFLKEHAPAIEGFGGDEHTYHTALMIKDLGISEEKCRALLTQKGGWNDRCDPPWSLSELAVKIKNAYKYGNNEAGNKGVLEPEDAFNLEGMDIEIQTEQQVRSSKFQKLYDIAYRGSAFTRRGKQREMVIPEYLPAHGFTIFLAKRGTGKTTVMLDLALRVACDMDWHGVPVEEDWGVVYLCGEDDEGLESMMRAWSNHYEREPAEDRFMVLEGVPNLMNAGEVETYAEFLKEQMPNRRCIVFLDTWQRASASGAQSDDSEMQVAVAHTEALAKSLNGPAIVAFHPPKHNDHIVMGSSVIENSSTAIWELESIATGRKLEVTRIKGKGMGNFHMFDWHEVDLGEEDKFGKKLTGVVPLKKGGTGFNNATEDHTLYKSALAKVIRELDMDKRDPEEGDPDPTPYTIQTVSEDMSQLSEWAARTDARGDWAKDLIGRLQQAGIVDHSEKNLAALIKELYVKDPTGYKYEDGNVLRVRKKGNAKQFFIEKG